ncbi:NADH-quinone oxidoreductase subunit N [Solitalea koreensis]|uniref:NADH-quinone oxidoreductase subunit N n=1 Tax=Solitalea koreensis TaxID=543615 RepID=A0A521ALF6_9SPHI|nr:NADH-quinone oxidoreductase subunit N [Solitalea koreensis]SMO35635.1 NADH dehydrogenase subunit N [Solitalea koreensis]
MTVSDLNALMPLTIIAVASVVIMLLIAFKLNHKIIQAICALSFIVSLVSLSNRPSYLSNSLHQLFIIDGFSIFVLALILFSGLVINVFSYIYFEEKEENPKEYYILLLLCTLGAEVLVISNHFFPLFIGLEILSIGLYVLIAYLRTRNFAIEAGIKYLMLAAFSSAFLLFGMALIYTDTGTMQFNLIADHLNKLGMPSIIFLVGFGLMLIAIGFKLALVPFHMWTADVYQGAPLPVTAFIATVSKAAMFTVLIHFFNTIGSNRFQISTLIITLIAIASMLIGNLLALNQQNLKRLLAYSSIAHLGYLLFAFLSSNKLGIEAVSFYLFAYFITTLGAFGVVTILSSKEQDADHIDNYRGLFWHSPIAAIVMTIALLSLAGIPLTAGFIGKFYILSAGIDAHLWMLAIVLVLSSVIGLFYYLRIITTMFSKGDKHIIKENLLHPAYYILSASTLLFLTICMIWFGIYPIQIILFIRSVLN